MDEYGNGSRIFAEYNSRDAQGNVLDLSKRKTEYQYKDRQTGKEVSGTCRGNYNERGGGQIYVRKYDSG